MREKNLPKEFGRRLRAAREARGLTQRDVAERAELADKYVSRIEIGAATPSVLVASRLARAVGVSVDALVGSDGGQRSQENPGVGRILRLLRGRSEKDLARAARVLKALLD